MADNQQAAIRSKSFKSMKWIILWVILIRFILISWILFKYYNTANKSETITGFFCNDKYSMKEKASETMLWFMVKCAFHVAYGLVLGIGLMLEKTFSFLMMFYLLGSIYGDDIECISRVVNAYTVVSVVLDTILILLTVYYAYRIKTDGKLLCRCWCCIFERF